MMSPPPPPTPPPGTISLNPSPRLHKSSKLQLWAYKIESEPSPLGPLGNGLSSHPLKKLIITPVIINQTDDDILDVYDNFCV